MLRLSTELDECTAKLCLLYSDKEVETRIRAKAAKLAAENRRLYAAGFQVPLLEVNDFVQYAWLIALKNRPSLPDRTAMIFYFWRRMENLFSDKCRKPAKARMRGVSMDAGPELSSGQAEIGILSFQEFREGRLELEKAEALKGFHEYLKGRDAELLPLLRLITLDGIDNPREQAKRLGVQVKDIYRLRARLQLQAERYGSSLNHKK